MSRAEIQELLAGAIYGPSLDRELSNTPPARTSKPGWSLVGLTGGRGETLWRHPEHGWWLRRLAPRICGVGAAHMSHSEGGVSYSGQASFVPVKLPREVE